MSKLVSVTAEYSAEQVRAGADVIQIFDSWVGCLSVEDYRQYVLPHVTAIGEATAEDGSTGHLLRHRQRHAVAFDEGNRRRCHRPRLAHPSRRRLARAEPPRGSAGQSGSCLLFADWKELKSRAELIFCAGPPAVPVTSLISATASFPRLRCRM